MVALARVRSNGVRTVLIEDAGRFARDLMVQESDIADLLAEGVTVITAAGDNFTASDDPGRVALTNVMPQRIKSAVFGGGHRALTQRVRIDDNDPKRS